MIDPSILPYILAAVAGAIPDIALGGCLSPSCKGLIARLTLATEMVGVRVGPRPRRR
jgi:hypothetical protein